jgi:hypothetical protein
MERAMTNKQRWWPWAVVGVAAVGALTGVALGLVEKVRDAAARQH